jgi:ribosomal protein S4E
MLGINVYLYKSKYKNMKTKTSKELNDGDLCQVVSGIHTGKSGIVQDIHLSKTGQITITVEQKNGERFKTLGKNVIVQSTKS